MMRRFLNLVLGPDMSDMEFDMYITVLGIAGFGAVITFLFGVLRNSQEQYAKELKNEEKEVMQKKS